MRLNDEAEEVVKGSDERARVWRATAAALDLATIKAMIATNKVVVCP